MSHIAISDNKSFLSTQTKVSKSSKIKNKIFTMFKKKKNQHQIAGQLVAVNSVATNLDIISQKTNLEYMRLSDHFKVQQKGSSNRGGMAGEVISRDSLVLFKLEDIKQIKQQDKLRIVTTSTSYRRGAYRKQTHHEKQYKTFRPDTQTITAETKATSVLSINGPNSSPCADQISPNTKKHAKQQGQSQNHAAKGESHSDGGSSSSDSFDAQLDEDMELGGNVSRFQKASGQCVPVAGTQPSISAIGMIPMSASLQRERQNQGSLAKSFVSSASMQLSDNQEDDEDGAGAPVSHHSRTETKPREGMDDLLSLQDLKEIQEANDGSGIMVAVALDDLVKDQDLKEIVVLKEETTLYKADLVVDDQEKLPNDGENNQEPDEIIKESEANSIQNFEKEVLASNEALKNEECDNVRFSVMSQVELKQIIEEKKKQMNIDDLSQSSDPNFLNQEIFATESFLQARGSIRGNSTIPDEAEPESQTNLIQNQDAKTNSLIAAQTEFDDNSKDSDEEENVPEGKITNISRLEQEQSLHAQSFYQSEALKNQMDASGNQNNVKIIQYASNSSVIQHESQITNHQMDDDVLSNLSVPEQFQDQNIHLNQIITVKCSKTVEKEDELEGISNESRLSVQSDKLIESQEACQQHKLKLALQKNQMDHLEFIKLQTQQNISQEQQEIEKDHDHQNIESAKSNGIIINQEEPVSGRGQQEEQLAPSQFDHPEAHDDINQLIGSVENGDEIVQEQPEEEEELDLHLENTQVPDDDFSSHSRENISQQSDLMDLNDIEEQLKMQMVDSFDDYRLDDQEIPKQSILGLSIERVISSQYLSGILAGKQGNFINNIYINWLKNQIYLELSFQSSKAQFEKLTRSLKMFGFNRINHIGVIRRLIEQTKDEVPLTPLKKPQIQITALTIDTAQSTSACPSISACPTVHNHFTINSSTNCLLRAQPEITISTLAPGAPPPATTEDDLLAPQSPDNTSCSLNSSMNMSMLNGSLEIKGSVSLNLEDTLAFIEALSFEERLREVTQRCDSKSAEMFLQSEPIEIMMAELRYNGYERKYLKVPDLGVCEEMLTESVVKDELNKEFGEQLQTLREKLKEKADKVCELKDGELMAIMLFTHENQELYRDIKTNMTGKKMDKRKISEQALNDSLSSTPAYQYLRWKLNYQDKAKRSYRWPALQVLLQIAVVKICLSRVEPESRFLNYGLAFLCINSVNGDDGKVHYEFDFEYPQKCPFNSSISLTLIESIKIFGLVKMELVKFLNQSVKFDLSHMTSQNRKGFKKFKDKLQLKRSQTNRSSLVNDYRDMAAQARQEARAVVSSMLNSSIIFHDTNNQVKCEQSVLNVRELPSPLLSGAKTKEIEQCGVRQDMTLNTSIIKIDDTNLNNSNLLNLDQQSEQIINKYQEYKESCDSEKLKTDKQVSPLLKQQSQSKLSQKTQIKGRAEPKSSAIVPVKQITKQQLFGKNSVQKKTVSEPQNTTSAPSKIAQKQPAVTGSLKAPSTLKAPSQIPTSKLQSPKNIKQTTKKVSTKSQKTDEKAPKQQSQPQKPTFKSRLQKPAVLQNTSSASKLKAPQAVSSKLP